MKRLIIVPSGIEMMKGVGVGLGNIQLIIVPSGIEIPLAAQTQTHRPSYNCTKWN